MRQILCRAFAIIVMTVSAVPSVAQAIGTYPLGSFSGGPDVINLGNLNVHWDIPIVNKPGRGANFAYELTYDSLIWRPVSSGSVTTWQPTQDWGWNGLTTAGQVYANYAMTYTSGSCGQYGTQSYQEWQYSNVTYSDENGILHSFSGVGGTYYNSPGGNYCPPPGAHPSGTMTATDGTGMTLDYSFGAGSMSLSFYKKDGTNVNPPVYQNNVPPASTSYTSYDGNGNEISMSNGTYTDTLNTTALAIAGTAPQNTTLSFLNNSGNYSEYTVSYLPHNIQTSFNCSGINEYSASNVYLPSSISLPDGRSYTFSYDGAGRLTSVGLPTGGSIGYTYIDGNSGIECKDGTTAGLERTTPDTGNGYWKYDRTAGVGTNQWITTVTAPTYQAVQDQTAITFLTDGVGYRFYEIERQTYAGSSSLQATVLSCYETAANDSLCSSATGDTGTAVPSPVTRLKRTIQFPGGSGSLSKGYIDTFDSSYGNILSHEVHDYAAGATFGGVLETTTTTYSTTYFPNGGEAPTEVKVTDGQSNWISDTLYGYSNTTTATSGTPQHVSNVSPGNLVSVQRWVSGSGAGAVYQTASFTYYDTGNLSTATDFNGSNVTTYSYGTNSCGNSFVTGTSTPVKNTSGAVTATLTTSAAWNCNGGVPTSTTDVNSNTTTYNYGSDPYWRPASITDPAQNVTSFSYPSSSAETTYSSSLTFNSGTSIINEVSIGDALGRPWLQQKLQGPSASNYDSLATAYDSHGRPYCRTTVPYSAPAGSGSYIQPTSTNGTCTVYDALGRAKSQSDPGGGSATYQYPFNTDPSVLAGYVYVNAGPAPAGEQSKSRLLGYNGAGQLTSVCEITSLPGSGSCGTGSGYNGYLTKYSYDALNLTKVQQNVQSSNVQTRTINAYDGLGRVLSETVPESSAGDGVAGTTTYTYDSDTTCNAASAGDLVKKIDNDGNVICNTYDSLHRVLSSSVNSGPYASSTPATNYVYDASTCNGVAMQNAAGSLAEAYTGSSASKSTDICFSNEFSTSGATTGGIVSKVWESTPHSGGYFLTTDTYFPNGTVGAITGSLVNGPTSSLTNQVSDSTQFGAQLGGNTWWPYCGNSNNTTLNAAQAPDGSDTATQWNVPSSFVCSSSYGSWGSYTEFPSGLTSGATYTVSVWLRGAVGGEVVTLGLNDCNTSAVTLTTSWSRYAVTFTNVPTGCSTGDRGFEMYSTTASAVYYGWAPQTVQASTMEPYVATTSGPATYIGVPSVTYGVDGEGRPTSANDGRTSGLVSSVSYNNASLPGTITYANSATGSGSDTDVISYDPNTSRPTNIAFNINPTSNPFAVTTALTWNANGSLHQMVYTDGNDASKNQTCSYSADDLGRIASADCGAGTWAQTFTYDPFGNIKKAGNPGTSYSANYSTATNQVSSGISPSPSYDANGNQLSSTPAATLGWNARNQLVSVNSTTATYDALGRMVETASGSTYKQFVYRPSGGLVSVYSAGAVKGTIPLPGGGTAVYSAGGLNFIRHSDWLGSSRLATNWAHGIYSKEAYAPFGETYNESGSPVRSFTGQDQNVVTGSGGNGVYDYLFRKYDPSAGRWLSPDPAGWAAADLSNPQSLNRYAYVLNNPQSMIDPLGLDSCNLVGANADGDVVCSWTEHHQNGDITINVADLGPIPGYQNASWTPGPDIYITWIVPTHLVQSGGAPNNANKQQIKNCVSNFYNSKLGAAVQFGSPISLLPGWNPGWGSNLKEWGIAIVGKLGGLFGSGAVPGTTQITTLTGTQTVGSGVELATEGGLAAVEKVATPAMGAATLVDIMAHSACAQSTDSAAWNYAFSNTMF